MNNNKIYVNNQEEADRLSITGELDKNKETPSPDSRYIISSPSSIINTGKIGGVQTFKDNVDGKHKWGIKISDETMDIDSGMNRTSGQIFNFISQHIKPY